MKGNGRNPDQFVWVRRQNFFSFWKKNLLKNYHCASTNIWEQNPSDDKFDICIRYAKKKHIYQLHPICQVKLNRKKKRKTNSTQRLRLWVWHVEHKITQNSPKQNLWVIPFIRSLLLKDLVISKFQATKRSLKVKENY